MLGVGGRESYFSSFPSSGLLTPKLKQGELLSTARAADLP